MLAAPSRLLWVGAGVCDFGFLIRLPGNGALDGALCEELWSSLVGALRGSVPSRTDFGGRTSRVHSVSTSTMYGPVAPPDGAVPFATRRRVALRKGLDRPRDDALASWPAWSFPWK